MDYSIADRPTGFLFLAQGDGTAPLQLQFLAEAEQFVYLRKGEWGVGEFVTALMAWLETGGWEAVEAGVVDISEPLLQWSREALWKEFLVDASFATGLSAVIAESLDRIVGKVTRIYKATRKWLEGRSADQPSTSECDRLVICTGRPKEDTLAFCKLANIHVRLNRGSASQSRHRYYVNEKHFCLFLALGERRYLGWYGDDAQVIQALKADFEKEWRSNGDEAALV